MSEERGDFAGRRRPRGGKRKYVYAIDPPLKGQPPFLRNQDCFFSSSFHSPSQFAGCRLVQELSGGTRRSGPGLLEYKDSGTNMGNSTSSAGGQSGSSSANQSGGSSSGGLGSRIAGSSGSHRSVHLPISSLSLPFRSGGSLGLSKAELDARCQPSG